ncbi:MAG: peptidase [Alphaproteobacteria bacterium]|nr:peptidase [Alphaproteobacteria bacterium]
MLSVCRHLLLCLAAGLVASSAGAQQPGPQGGEAGRMREQDWRVPTASGGLLMDTTLFRPPGNGPFPLAVMNHGSPADGSERPTMKRPTYTALSTFLVARGYAVALPLRRGYGLTGGGWAEDYGSCSGANYGPAGLATASDIQATIDFMRKQPFILPDRTLVLGQSAGAWGTVALSSLNPQGVPAMLAFAPGRGGHQPGVGNCAPGNLVKAAGGYGATARVPLLWVNAANDTFFEPKLVDQMVGAYKAGGGNVTHRAVGPFEKEGHNLASRDSGASTWQPIVTEFFAANGIR